MDLTLGSVSLVVRDLEPMTNFYVKDAGLRMKRIDDHYVELHPSEESSEPLLILKHDPRAEKTPTDAAGLYHYAILLPSRKSLAAAYLSLGNAGVVFDGYADHLVSEALYLTDPEGNGIEIYADRPRSEWQFDEDRKVQMATQPLDIDSLLAEVSGIPKNGLNTFEDGAKVGHVHLKVTDITRSVTFYQQLLGMDVMSYWGSAAFLSVRGYHHHIGMNTWESLGGRSVKRGWAGLEYFTVNVTREDFNNLLAKLSNSSIPYSQDPERLFVADPDGIDLLIKPSSQSTT
jgi:catechol 2,3-dioxygenase